MSLINNPHLKEFHELTLPLTCLKGIGPGRAALLGKKGLYTILDLLYFLPIRYQDRTRLSPIGTAIPGDNCLVRGRVIYGKEERFYRRRLFKILIQDESSSMELVWFNYRKQHLTNLAIPGTDLIAYGPVNLNRNSRQIIHPEVTRLDKDNDEELSGFCPVYSSVSGISEKMLRTLIKDALDFCHSFVVDHLPEGLLLKHNLPNLMQAIEHAHFPPRGSLIDQLNRSDTSSHHRLMFDRFFLVMLTIAHKKKTREELSVPAFSVPYNLSRKIKKFFPFSLTSHQERAVKEVENDIASKRPMNRLLMGDVGCGKTVIAAISAYISVQNNKQTAIMAPTQVLADQHMKYFSSLSGVMGFQPILLNGNLKKAERNKIYKKIKEGRYNMVIGTHSLIQEALSFKDLGLVIIDEQHRFGVKQRALIGSKGDNPHILVMSATPIPRTLAITVYGDMDISMIREYPEGYIPAETYIINKDRKKWAFDIIKERLSIGQQAFVICPTIEESKETDLRSVRDMEERFKKALSPPYRIDIIHGRKKKKKKEQVMTAFYKGKINLLVGTTVVEVGVHVPNATIMVIEHPERFGLAQLHQLRGRVGRGTKRGLCLLIQDDKWSEENASRIKVLASISDGFEVAQKDLELRGHGELTGMKQSGMGDLNLGEIMRYPDLLLAAREEAEKVVDSDPGLLRPDHSILRDIMESALQKPLDL